MTTAKTFFPICSQVRALPLSMYSLKQHRIRQKARSSHRSIGYALMLWLQFGLISGSAQPQASIDTAMRPRLIESYRKLPLTFEANRGQIDEQVTYLARGSGYTLFLTRDSAAVLLLRGQEKNSALRIKMLGANFPAEVTGTGELPGKSNYFIGRDLKKWRTNVPTYSGVKYTAVYPGIDLVYYGNQRLLEYDFVVAPGADPQAIGIRFEGVRKLTLSRNGALVIRVGGSEVIEPAPVVYQEIDGRRKTVAGRYVLRGKNRIGFSVDEYDHSLPLVIDPTLAYSTLLGGSSDDYGSSIATDAAGDVYLTGMTYSADFPGASGTRQTTLRGTTDAFIVKLNAAGTALVYSAFLGGSGGDLGSGIAIDAVGNAYIAGETDSTDFPVTPGAYQTTFGGYSDAFVAKLNATGSSLIYSTYLGGSAAEDGPAIAIDGSGNACLAGGTASSDFPTTPGAFQNVSGGNGDAFVTKLNAAGSALLYSTYLGGNDYDSADSIAIDTVGNAYVTGITRSVHFPTTPGAFQINLAGTGADAFVTKLSTVGFPVYSTYLGGGQDDLGAGIAVDAFGNAYLTGQTSSIDFPTTAGAFQSLRRGPDNAFVAKLNSTGSALAYSTYLGGSGTNEGGLGIAIDVLGNAYITGRTGSTDFPVTPGAVQSAFGGDYEDGFVSKLDATGSALLYSTYLGGNGMDRGNSITVDGSGNVYVSGYTASSNFPTTQGAFQTTSAGGNYKAFIAKLSSGVGAVISGMPPSGCTLWPPNHELVAVADVRISDAQSGILAGSLKVTGTSNEPSATGDPDIVITSDGSGGFIVQLRADRLGTGNGRVYTLNATAMDDAGNTATATSTCVVPHDQGN